MPKNSYQLINPVIEGTFRDVYDANQPIDAAKNMWSSLSEHIVAHVPKFMFTMSDISSGQLHHFEVSENRANSSFTINKREMKIDKKHFNEFAKNIDKYSTAREQQQGGGKRKRYDDSDSSDSSSTDYPSIRRTSPIAMFHYNTRVYFPNDIEYQSTLNPQAIAITTPIFTPIFRPVLGTFVGIWP
jgi:hypothetical protein